MSSFFSLLGGGGSGVDDEGPVRDRDLTETKGFNVESADVRATYKKQRNPKNNHVIKKFAHVSADIKLLINNQEIPIRLSFNESFNGGASVGEMMQQLRSNGRFQDLVMANLDQNKDAIAQLKNLQLQTKDGSRVRAGEVWDDLYSKYQTISLAAQGAYKKMPVRVVDTHGNKIHRQARPQHRQTTYAQDN